jgi:hypothetical protein
MSTQNKFVRVVTEHLATEDVNQRITNFSGIARLILVNNSYKITQYVSRITTALDLIYKLTSDTVSWLTTLDRKYPVLREVFDIYGRNLLNFLMRTNAVCRLGNKWVSDELDKLGVSQIRGPTDVRSRISEK